MIHSVIVEMRPRLQVCNVFIITDEYLKQDEYVRINIKTSVVEVTWQSGTCEIVQVINLHDYKLRPLSLSALQVLKKSISFRIQTAPVISVVGSFASEVLPIEQSSDMIQSATVKLLAPCIDTDRPCQLACKCCGKVMSKQDTLFTRVLPLPSSASWEVSDWFCHQHTGSSYMQHSVLAPKETDCLYGMCYILVSASVMNVRNKQVVRCNRCLAWLGTRINLTSLKLWNCTTSYEGNNNSTALEDFICTVKQAFNKSCVMNCRLVLETKLSEEHSQYLLLWVMDKNLDLLVSADEDISHLEENAGKVVLECKLRVKRTMKLLYMYRKACDSMVKTWQDDCNVECIEVAKPMFTEGLAYLLRGTELIPGPYKLTDSFLVTYLGL